MKQRVDYKLHPSKYHAKNKAYRSTHRDEIRERDASYRADHAEQLQGYFREYYINNREARKQNARIYARNNRAKRLAYLASYRKRYAQKLAEQQHEYRRRNRVKCKIYGLNYLARKANAPGFYKLEQWEELCNFFNGVCPCCGKPTESFEADHIIPLTWHGTTNWLSNIQPLCKECNTSKGNHHDTDYRPTFIRNWARCLTLKLQETFL